MPSQRIASKFSITPRTLALTLWIAAFAVHLRAEDSLRYSADPKIAAALQQVSAEHVRANIEKLVSFGTRLTLSAQDPASIASGRGIGAAREWIRSEFERYSKECGGCLEVKTDAFIEGQADRIPQATQITNVYAVLKGTDPEGSKRIVLVTGHYDSRNSDTFDAKGDAPGANDDASGTCRQPGVRARPEQAEVSRDDYFSDGSRRGAGTQRQCAFRQDGEGARLATRSCS